MLYAGSSSFTVRAMFAAGCVNMLVRFEKYTNPDHLCQLSKHLCQFDLFYRLQYWSHHLVNCIVYKDVIIQGIDLGGQPYWTAFGYLGTGLIFYCNREYATHAAHSVYESADGKRIGFQMYNMVGLPGRRIEATIGNVRLANTASWNLGSDSFVPLRIVGKWQAYLNRFLSKDPPLVKAVISI